MHGRGFTLVEFMVTILVSSALLTMGAWAGSRMLAASRSTGAARQFIYEMRSAAAIAARINRRVQLIVDNEGDAGCNPSWRVQTIPNVGEDVTVFNRICVNADFPGVEHKNAGIAAEVTCASDTASGEPALTNCSLCTGTAAITLYPSGEFLTPQAVQNGATLMFSPTGDDRPSATVAVGIRDGTGRTRIYKPNDAGSGWECP